MTRPRAEADGPPARTRLAAKAKLWDALCARAISIRLRGPRGPVTIEANDPRRVAAVLEQVLGAGGAA